MEEFRDFKRERFRATEAVKCRWTCWSCVAAIFNVRILGSTFMMPCSTTWKGGILECQEREVPSDGNSQEICLWWISMISKAAGLSSTLSFHLLFIVIVSRYILGVRSENHIYQIFVCLGSKGMDLISMPKLVLMSVVKFLPPFHRFQMYIIGYEWNPCIVGSGLKVT